MKTPDYGVIAIGRNEGERLKQCLRSVSDTVPIVYVDSGSTDDSVGWAKDRGLDVVQLDPNIPFTAARARNAGFKRLREIAPGLNYVQFIDGDCELNESWPQEAISFLDEHPAACAAFGRRRERYPDKSIYNRLCDREWNTPIGEALACGGDVMIRVDALQIVGGYRDELIAGEEPELCARLRTAGWQIWRLDFEMTLHDAAITHFYQWWQRTVRSGYAYALWAELHGTAPDRQGVWQSHRALLWGLYVPIGCLVAIILFGIWGTAGFLIYPLQLLRRALLIKGTMQCRIECSFFEMISRFPEAIGQIKFLGDRLRGHAPDLIEYK